jgi:DNA-binding MarR family transcriptional regulator
MRTKPTPGITDQLAPLFRRVSRLHNAALASFELRAVEAHILGTLWTAGPMQVAQLKKELAIRGSTLTGALDRLEKRELLRREPVVGDRRALRLVASKWSRGQRQKLYKAVEEVEETCYGALTQAERTELLRLLTKANAGLAAED